jgi:hypothetical protein
MLKFLDSVLEFIFGYGPPIFVALAGIISVIAFLGVLVHPNIKGKGHILGIFGINAVCSWGYFEWFDQMKNFENGTLAMSVYSMGAFFVFLFVLLFGLFLTNIIRVPAFLVFLFYLGIAIFGV